MTRRTLMRGAASTLLLPGSAVARMGGAPMIGGFACTNISHLWAAGAPAIYPVEITGPGNYCLTADQTTGGRIDVAIPNVTIDGNGHTLNGLLTFQNYSGGGNFVASGITLKNLTLQQIQVIGNTSATQTSPPAVTLQDVTITQPSNTLQGSNIVLRRVDIGWGLAQITDDWSFASGGPVAGAADDWNYWHLYDSCRWGPCTDVGHEGSGKGWDHCTFINCTSYQGGFGGIGGWYVNPCCSNGYGFHIVGCTFTGNTINKWRFTDPANNGAIPEGTSDLISAGYWPGNNFGSPAGAPNVYV